MADTGFFQSFVNHSLRDWVNEPHSVCLLSNMWMFDRNTHSNIAHVPPAAILATAPIEGREVDAGVMIGDDVTFANFVSDVAPYAILIKNDATGALVGVFTDTNGLNVMPNGLDTLLRWNACGIMAL